MLDFNTNHIDSDKGAEYLSFSKHEENEMNYASLSLDRLKEVLAYNPSTGDFTWKARPSHNSRRKVGDEAGCLKPSGYRYINIDNRSYTATQLAWFYVTGKWARGRIGVKNEIPSDVRFENLFEFKAAPGKHDQGTVEGRAQWRRAHKDAHPTAHRSYGWKRFYGLSAEDYQRMFAEQGGNCAICNRPERAKTSRGGVKWLCVDHNHETTAVRGLLCFSCNYTIGQMEDNPDWLEAAAAYLRHHKSKEPA